MMPIVPFFLAGAPGTGMATGGPVYGPGCAANGAGAGGTGGAGGNGAAAAGAATTGTAPALTLLSFPHFTQKRSVASICAPQLPQNAISSLSPYPINEAPFRSHTATISGGFVEAFAVPQIARLSQLAQFAEVTATMPQFALVAPCATSPAENGSKLIVDCGATGPLGPVRVIWFCVSAEPLAPY